MFRGRFTHTIDTKGRVSVPVAFRDELKRLSEKPPILTNLPECAALYPYEGWVELERQLAEASSTQPDVQALQRFMVSGAQECPIDAQGRILVPAWLREHAALDHDVTIAGVGKRIELWDKTRFDHDLVRTKTRIGEVSAAVRQFGL
jgi:MraZ protein